MVFYVSGRTTQACNAYSPPCIVINAFVNNAWQTQMSLPQCSVGNCLSSGPAFTVTFASTGAQIWYKGSLAATMPWVAGAPPSIFQSVVPGSGSLASATQLSAVGCPDPATRLVPQFIKVVWTGFFLARETGVYTFTFGENTDDAAYLWLGAPPFGYASEGWGLENTLLSYNWFNRGSPNSANISLIGCTYYPIRIEFGAPPLCLLQHSLRNFRTALGLPFAF